MLVIKVLLALGPLGARALHLTGAPRADQEDYSTAAGLSKYSPSERQNEDYSTFQQRLADRKAGGDRPSLSQIMLAARTDKLWRHGYHRYYEGLLAPFRDQPGLRLLEIGAAGGASLQVWVEYFSQATSISGVAYNVDPVLAKEKACQLSPRLCEVVDVYSVDQSNASQLESLVSNSTGPWDIIVDDGSHVPLHILTSFKHLFPRLRPGGLYIVEDIETSYVAKPKELYGYEINAGLGATPPMSAVEKFKQLVDVVNRRHFSHEGFTVFGGEVDGSIAEVRFMDGMVAIQKKPSDKAWDTYPAQDRMFVTEADAEPAVRTFMERLAREAPIP